MATNQIVAIHKQERYLYCLKLLLQKILLERLIDGHAPVIHDVRMFLECPGYERKEPFVEDVARRTSDHLILHNPDIDFNERIGHAIKSIVSPNVWLFWHLLGKADLDHASAEAGVLHTSEYTVLTRCSKAVYVHMREVNGELRSRRQANHIQHPCECSFDEAYIKLVRQAFKLDDLQRSFDRRTSPLLEVIVSSQGLYENIDTGLQVLNANLRIWLEVLLSAGVGLENYGQQEHEYFRANDSYGMIMVSNKRVVKCQLRLVNFQWGRLWVSGNSGGQPPWMRSITRSCCIVWCPRKVRRRLKSPASTSQAPGSRRGRSNGTGYTSMRSSGVPRVVGDGRDI